MWFKSKSKKSPRTKTVKTVRRTIRIDEVEDTTLKRICKAKGYDQADAYRAAVHEWNANELKKRQEWSPVREADLDPRDNPGVSGYDQTKERFNPALAAEHPELITTYEQKRSVRQWKLRQR